MAYGSGNGKFDIINLPIVEILHQRVNLFRVKVVDDIQGQTVISRRQLTVRLCPVHGEGGFTAHVQLHIAAGCLGIGVACQLYAICIK